ncbi:PH domain-containing protein [Longispora albida]|uniref:PH domain-containing protein n=1 Tax=Longispora albida TaxID=203523 RepID=UPI000A0187FF|nr:PH domain-containing protein [Longispora albida]
MTGAAGRRRNSPAMFAIRVAQHATTIAPAVIAWLSIRTRWPVPLGIPVDAVFGLVGGLAVLSLVADWWTTRFSVGKERISYDTGLLFRRSVSISWAEVVSVQVSRSAVARALGCARVLIGIGAESKASLVIEAVPQPVAAEIERHFERNRLEIPVPGAGPADPGELIYRIRLRDYLLISVTYGQFVLLVPFLFEVYENTTALLPFSPVLPELPERTGPLWMLAVTAVAVCGSVALAFGLLVAWLRYRSFEVRLRAGVFAMSGGLISAESRQVPADHVVGVKIQRNPLMRVAGYARLALVSRQSGERIGANIVFPAARLERVLDGVRDHFPAYAAAVGHRPQVSRTLRWGLISVATATFAFAAWFTADLRPVRAAVLLAALAIALLAACNYCWAAAQADPDNAVVHFRRGFLWVTHYVVPWDSVYFAASWQLSWSARLPASVVCLGVYDSKAIRLWVPVGRPVLADRFIDATTSGSNAHGNGMKA